jgi:hypothetical protein
MVLLARAFHPSNSATLDIGHAVFDVFPDQQK